MESTATNEQLSSDRRRSRRRSRPCPICLEQIENRAFPNKCRHRFCKPCLVQWAKVKDECPVCRRQFDKIIYNFRPVFDELTVASIRCDTCSYIA